MKLRSGTVIIAPAIQAKTINKPVKKCSFCKKPGHNITACNEKIEALIVTVLFRFINSCETKEELNDTLYGFTLVKLKLLVKHFKLTTTTQTKRRFVEQLMPLCIENQTTQWINNYEIIKEILEEHPGQSLTDIAYMKVTEIIRNIHNRDLIYDSFVISNWFDRLKFNHQSPTIRNQIYNGYVNAFTHINAVAYDNNSNYYWKIEPIMPRLYTESELNEIKQCPICYDDTPEINLMTTNCKHTFCNTCITTHLHTERNKCHPHCPMCRSTITTMNIKSITLFDEFSNIYNV
jgi:hypothetical protein